MKNFADGHGFVYNIGSEKVEGFTSILWTLIGSLIFKFTSHIEFILLSINFILIFLSIKIILKLIYSYIDDYNLASNYSLLFLGLLFIFPGFFDWTIFSLLETGLWTFELTVFTYLLVIPYLSDNFTFNKSSILIALIVPFFIITRPESMLFCLVFIGIRFIQLLIEKQSFKVILQQVSTIIFTYLISLFLLTKWRLYYFGFPFPNTYYIKMTDGFTNNLHEGFIYFIKYLIRINPLIVLLIACIIIWIYLNILSKKYTSKNKTIAVLVILTGLGISIPFYTGGDHFRMSRFYQTFSPIFHLTSLFIVYSLSKKYSFLRKIESKKVVIISLFLLSILPINNLYSLIINNKNTIAIEFHIAKENRIIGEKLNHFFEHTKKPSIGYVTAGGIAYTYNGYVNDVLGLNNIEVAHTIDDRPQEILKSHRAFNKSVFLKQHPELFLNEFVSDTTLFIPFAKRKNIDNEFGSRVIKHIYKDLDFNKQYTPVYIINKRTKAILFSYAYNEYLRTLDTSLYTVRIIQ